MAALKHTLSLHCSSTQNLSSTAFPPLNLATNPSVHQPQTSNGSWRSNLFDPINPSLSRGLVFLEPTVDGDKRIASCRKAEIDLIAKEWEGKLLGFLLGKKRPHLPSLKKAMVAKWSLKSPLDLSFHGDGAILLKFGSEVEKVTTLDSGPWFFSGRLLVLKPWRRHFKMSDFDTSSIPIWVRLPNLPVEFWSSDSLSRIGSLMGRPVFSDEMTASRERSSYARICVEISALEEFPTEVLIDIEGSEGFSQAVKAEWKPVRCPICKVFFHDLNSCPISKVPSNVLSVPPKKPGPELDSTAVEKEVWKVVQSRKKQRNFQTGSSSTNPLPELTPDFLASREVPLSHLELPELEPSFGERTVVVCGINQTNDRASVLAEPDTSTPDIIGMLVQEASEKGSPDSFSFLMVGGPGVPKEPDVSSAGVERISYVPSVGAALISDDLKAKAVAALFENTAAPSSRPTSSKGLTVSVVDLPNNLNLCLASPATCPRFQTTSTPNPPLACTLNPSMMSCGSSHGTTSSSSLSCGSSISSFLGGNDVRHSLSHNIHLSGMEGVLNRSHLISIAGDHCVVEEVPLTMSVSDGDRELEFGESGPPGFSNNCKNSFEENSFETAVHVPDESSESEEGEFELSPFKAKLVHEKLGKYFPGTRNADRAFTEFCRFRQLEIKTNRKKSVVPDAINLRKQGGKRVVSSKGETVRKKKL